MSKERLSYVVLGIFLILSGLVSLVSGLGSLGIVVSILALAAGVLILIFRPGISIFTGWILAAIYLILLGLTGIINFGFAGMGTVMAILAIAAGIVLAIRWPGFRHHIGFLLFCVWLILLGLMGLIGLGGFGVIVAIVAIASGVLMILNE
jgi:hypothetical protein